MPFLGTRRNQDGSADFLYGTSLGQPSPPRLLPAADIDAALMASVPTHEEQVVSLLTEIRDTLQGRRGFLITPSAAECERFGKAVR